jgi:CRISPR-associated protein Csm1
LSACFRLISQINVTEIRVVGGAYPTVFQGFWRSVRAYFSDIDLSNSYKRSFVRNLLLTAQIQEQQLEEKKQAVEHYRNTHPNAKEDAAMKALKREEQDIRYYLHLPKIAYTLARLPSDLRQRDEFRSMRISLLSPYNSPYFRAIATWIELLTRNKP